jgi:hypothetical protein
LILDYEGLFKNGIKEGMGRLIELKNVKDIG